MFDIHTEVDGRLIPESLRERDIWVLWDGDDKTVKAPWSTGHMYPASWTDDTGERVTCDYEKAQMVADLPVSVIADTYPFPDGGHRDAIPTILLPESADDYDPPLMLIDLDDVRDPDTGYITEEAARIVAGVNSYTEVSQSGAGLHVYVWARLPGGLKRFIQSLEMVGGIELYDSGRLSAATWQHVAGTPRDVTDAQDAVEKIIKQYGDSAQLERRDNHDELEEAKKQAAEVLEPRITSRTGSAAQNAYYQLGTYDIARMDAAFAAHESGGQGPHPAHGAQSGSNWDSESTNFSCEKDGRWHCFLHGSGGGPLDLIAVMEGVVSCDYFVGSRLEDDHANLLKTCLLARDRYASSALEGEKPPHKALLAVAEQFSLTTKADGSLTRDAYSIAISVFESMEVESVNG
jgi:hypothetical protein